MPQVPEKCSDRFRKVMALARQEALRLNHCSIEPEHVLFGLIKEGSGVGANAIISLGVDLRKARLEIEKLVVAGKTEVIKMGEMPWTPKTQEVLEFAEDESLSMGHVYLGTEHLLLGLLREGNNIASTALKNLNLDIDKVRETIKTMLCAVGQKPEESEPSDDGEEVDLPDWRDDLDRGWKSLGVMILTALTQAPGELRDAAARDLRFLADAVEAIPSNPFMPASLPPTPLADPSPSQPRSRPNQPLEPEDQEE